MHIKIIIVILFVLTSLFSSGQNDTTTLSRENALKVYIDCNYCDQQYFKENFTLINYVRDRKEADVQIIVTTMETGSGGDEFTLQFIGRKNFKRFSDTLSFSLPSDYTDDEERTGLLKHIQLGLVPYIMKTPFADKINLSFDSNEEAEKEKDPWNNWVFRIYTRGYGQKEKSFSQMNFNSGLSAGKVTKDIKIQFNLQNYYNESKYRLYENDSLVYKNDVYTRSYSFYNLTTWSIGDHWGIGWFAGARNSTYSNLKLKANFSPAVEYNVFSYEEATHKQLRFLYSVGYKHMDYIDTTIYNTLHDRLFEQELRLMFSYVAEWGSIDANVSWENYMHDFNLYSVGMFLGTSIRIVKGLSFELYGTVEIPRNQITLRKAGTTPEEILTRQHEMQSNYSLWVHAGLSYTFGSIFNNVVNPRFE